MKHLILDFDGTIADSFDETLAVFNLVTKRPKPLSPAEIDHLRTLSMSQVMRALGLKPWQVPILLFKGRRHMTARMAGIKPFPGLAPTFAQLNREGYQLHVISTNSAPNIHAFLRAHQLDHHFQTVTGSIGLIKSRALRKLLRQLRAAPSDCVYIGDETRDVDAAHAVHMPVLAVAWGFNAPSALAAHHPTGLVQTPADLAALTKKALLEQS
jgi:phosphoglycolate phosphatase-like HAD superfamily hydrolase